MHKTLLTDINADMRERLLVSVEEYQVAGLQLAGAHTNQTHLHAGARQLYSQRVQVNILYEAAAIEAIVQQIAAIAVRCIGLAQCIEHNIVHFPNGVRDTPDRVRDADGRVAGTEQQQNDK